MIMDRKGAAYKEGIVSIIINTILFGVKLSVGLLSGSLALISDAIHTMSDNVSSIFLMIAFKISGKEPDEDHPYGHERFEIMGTIVIGVLLLFTGIEIFRSGIISILSPKQISFTLLQIILIIISIVMKEGLAQYAMYLGKKFNAPAIKADGWHHRSDAISSAPVLLIIFFPGIDGWVSILISLVLIWESIDIIRKQLDDFLGKPPSRELINDIKNSVIKLEGVHNVHDIQLHRYGNTNVLSLHLEVEEKMNLFRAHTIAEQHEEMLSRKFHLSAVTIHIDPVNYNDPEVKALKEFIEKMVESGDKFEDAHDIRIIGEETWKNAVFDLIPSRNLKEKQINEAAEEMRKKLQAAFPHIKAFVINIDPKFNY